MDKNIALKEFHKMWVWLYKHPSHDKTYYVNHVAKPDVKWENDCPLCTISEDDDCNECLVIWDNGQGSLCSDPSSPLSKWKETDTHEPHRRTWYAGQIVGLSKK